MQAFLPLLLFATLSLLALAAPMDMGRIVSKSSEAGSKPLSELLSDLSLQKNSATSSPRPFAILIPARPEPHVVFDSIPGPHMGRSGGAIRGNRGAARDEASPYQNARLRGTVARIAKQKLERQSRLSQSSSDNELAMYQKEAGVNLQQLGAGRGQSTSERPERDMSRFNDDAEKDIASSRFNF